MWALASGRAGAACGLVPLFALGMLTAFRSARLALRSASSLAARAASASFFRFFASSSSSFETNLMPSMLEPGAETVCTAPRPCARERFDGAISTQRSTARVISRGTETSAEDLVGPPWRMESNAGQQQWY